MEAGFNSGGSDCSGQQWPAVTAQWRPAQWQPHAAGCAACFVRCRRQSAGLVRSTGGRPRRRRRQLQWATVGFDGRGTATVGFGGSGGAGYSGRQWWHWGGGGMVAAVVCRTAGVDCVCVSIIFQLFYYAPIAVAPVALQFCVSSSRKHSRFDVPPISHRAWPAFDAWPSYPTTYHRCILHNNRRGFASTAYEAGEAES